jgi:hypothetical protein
VDWKIFKSKRMSRCAEFKWKGKSRHWIHVAQYTKEVYTTIQGSIVSKFSFTYVDAILIQTYLSKSHDENKKIFEFE